MPEGSSFDMNALLRGEVKDPDSEQAASDEVASIGGKADAGAGQDREQTRATDMNSFLREAVSESRGRPA